jgi:hypothetical protein
MASPKSGPWWVLWIQICPWFVLAPKVFQLCTNPTCCLVLCKSVWVIKCFSFFLIPSRSSSTPLYPQSATNQETCPQLLALPLFSLQTHIWVYQGAWERVTISQSLQYVWCPPKPYANHAFNALLLPLILMFIPLRRSRNIISTKTSFQGSPSSHSLSP